MNKPAAPRFHRYFGRNEIAKRLKRHSNTVLRAFETGALEGIQADSRWFAEYADLAKWLGSERAEQLFGERIGKTASVDTRRERSVREDSETLGSKPSCRATKAGSGAEAACNRAEKLPSRSRAKRLSPDQGEGGAAGATATPPKRSRPLPPQARGVEKGTSMSDIAYLSPMQSQIINELYTTIEILGGDSAILAAIGSWGDTLPEEDVLSELQHWNAGNPVRPARRKRAA